LENKEGNPMTDFHQEGIITTLHALDFIKTNSDDAEVNGLIYDRHEVELTATHFWQFLWTAWEQSKGPRESTLIPSWNRVCYNVPDIYPQTLEAVEADNR
jgi:glucosyl-3-phosphoglycerate synthase